MSIQWKETMSVGIVEIDEQHKHFLELMNKTYEAAKNLQLSGGLESLINELIGYADMHFTTEEKYFDEYHFSNAIDHIARHRELKAKALEYQKRFEKEGVKLVAEFMNYLEDWLVNHLEDYDMKYAEEFRMKKLL